jgi:hypothetical protein
MASMRSLARAAGRHLPDPEVRDFALMPVRVQAY